MIDIEKELTKTINNNKLIYINKNIFLTNYEIEILDLYDIKYKNATNYQEILFYIEEEIEINIDSEELEQILTTISERNYYQNTHI